jgi:hypothetical protein
MESKSTDAFILTEMHLEGDFQQILQKKLFIDNGPENQPHQPAKGRVGMLLSPKLAKGRIDCLLEDHYPEELRDLCA